MLFITGVLVDLFMISGGIKSELCGLGGSDSTGKRARLLGRFGTRCFFGRLGFGARWDG